MKESAFWRNNTRDSRDNLIFLGYLLLPKLNRSLNNIRAYIKSFSFLFVPFLCPVPPTHTPLHSLPESPFLRLPSPHVLPPHRGQKYSGTAVFPPHMLLPLAHSDRGKSACQLSRPRASLLWDRCAARASPSRAARPPLLPLLIARLPSRARYK